MYGLLHASSCLLSTSSSSHFVGRFINFISCHLVPVFKQNKICLPVSSWTKFILICHMRLLQPIADTLHKWMMLPLLSSCRDLNFAPLDTPSLSVDFVAYRPSGWWFSRHAFDSADALVRVDDAAWLSCPFPAFSTFLRIWHFSSLSPFTLRIHRSSSGWWSSCHAYYSCRYNRRVDDADFQVVKYAETFSPL